MLPKTKVYLKSKIHRHLMLFFVENAGSVDTPKK